MNFKILYGLDVFLNSPKIKYILKYPMELDVFLGRPKINHRLDRLMYFN